MRRACTCHPALGVAQALGNDEVFSEFDIYMREFAQGMHMSTQRMEMLKELAEEFGLKARRIPCVAATRWLSRSNGVDCITSQ